LSVHNGDVVAGLVRDKHCGRSNLQLSAEQRRLLSLALAFRVGGAGHLLRRERQLVEGQCLSTPRRHRHLHLQPGENRSRHGHRCCSGHLRSVGRNLGHCFGKRFYSAFKCSELSLLFLQTRQSGGMTGRAYLKKYCTTWVTIPDSPGIEFTGVDEFPDPASSQLDGPTR
jgi:hypothetical protein